MAMPLASDGIAGAALSLVVSPYALIQKRHHPARTRSSGRGCARNTTPHACAHCGLGRAFAGAFRLPSESDSFAGFGPVGAASSVMRQSPRALTENEIVAHGHSVTLQRTYIPMEWLCLAQVCVLCALWRGQQRTAARSGSR